MLALLLLTAIILIIRTSSNSAKDAALFAANCPSSRMHMDGPDCAVPPFANKSCHCIRKEGSKNSVTSCCFGEFGYDLMIHLPLMYGFHLRGYSVKTCGPIGSKYLYSFFSNHTEITEIQRDYFLYDLPYGFGSAHPSILHRNHWVPPPLKSLYLGNQQCKKIVDRLPSSSASKPLLVIANKYSIEWDEPPKNFLSVEMLEDLFTLLEPHYTLLYIRPPSKPREGYSPDHQGLTISDLKDESALKKHPQVISFEKLLQKAQVHWNLGSLCLHARSERFISVQGGTSILSSFFQGTNIIFAVAGKEVDMDEYRYYRYLSNATIIHVKSAESLIASVREEFVPEIVTEDYDVQDYDVHVR
jgi:hypothetical protein